MKSKSHYLKDLSIYKGVSFLSPDNTFIEEGAKIGVGTTIEPNVIIDRRAKIGKNVSIYSCATIKNSIIGDQCIIGQFALVRDKTILKGKNIIGSYSEIARSIFEESASAFHKATILDAHIEEGVMLGAGVTTANTRHDDKRRITLVEKNAKIGINVSLVAPIKIGANSFVGAGSTITKNVNPNTTVVARGKQEELKR